MIEGLKGSERIMGALAIWNEIDPAHEAEYHRWYWEQHLPERLGVPGFLTGCRYRVLGGGPTYFTWYLVQDVEVLRSAAYLERLANPTDWTRRVMPWFRAMTRCACRITVDLGRGIGGTVAAIRLADLAGSEPDLRARLVREVLPELFASTRDASVTRLQLWETDREVSNQRTAEQTLRGEPDRLVDRIIVLHSPTPDAARDCATKLLDAAFRVEKTTGQEGPFIYTLMQCLAAAP